MPSGPLTGEKSRADTENPACTAYVEGELVRIECDEPVRAPARGQSAVLYDGDRVLGGGFII